MKRLLALLLGGLGLRALLRRRSPAPVGPSPADDLRAKLDETRVEAQAEPEAAPDADAMAFMDSFLAEYAEAMAKLAKR